MVLACFWELLEMSSVGLQQSHMGDRISDRGTVGQAVAATAL